MSDGFRKTSIALTHLLHISPGTGGCHQWHLQRLPRRPLGLTTSHHRPRYLKYHSTRIARLCYSYRIRFFAQCKNKKNLKFCWCEFSKHSFRTVKLLVTRREQATQAPIAKFGVAFRELPVEPFSLSDKA